MPNLSYWDRIFIHALQRLQGGQIRLSFADGNRFVLGQAGTQSADLVFLEAGLSKQFLLGGSMALAEAYMDGKWTTRDLSALLRILALSQREMGRVARGTSQVLRKMDGVMHHLRRNTKENAVKNIQEHYDLSNELYETFLDPSLTYSSAIFEEAGENLEQAQFRKIDRLIEQLDLKATDHVLEIGSGWGACAIRMAAQRGCRVTSLTLSVRQAEEGRRRVKAAGLDDLVEIRIQDYRDVEGVFDHVVSIEMVEAVGHEFLPEYFEAVQQHLKPGGRFALQAITIPDERYAEYNNSVDFIRKHIFPGGHLPSPQILSDLSGAVGFSEVDAFEFGKDYAETLRRWNVRFSAHVSRVKALGFDDTFIRKWQYYFCYCEAGFDCGLIHVRQLCYQRN
ncbi:cyclopropane-fatty-acyl-phospholipid synthase [Kiritimatiellaeota bacterium B1221]|nr:cyclopropane-fatty-acyl-phospholipid synthase [Kiritimatiellaeota bacterium B1221]